MLNIRKILVPTDLGPLSERVYSHAVEIAQRFGSTLTILHIAKPGSRPVSDDDLIVAGADSTDELDVSKVVLSAKSVPTAIINYAAEHEIDLIVMGGRGTAGLGGRRLGGVAAPVVRFAPCSVLTIRDRLPGGGLRRILVPVDLSEASRRQIETARHIAASFGSMVDVLAVRENLFFPATFGVAPLIGLEQEMVRRLETDLADFWDTIPAPEVPHQFHVRSGPAAPEIINFALQHASDMIVIATHGRTALRRLVLGSVAQHVTQSALSTVLTVKTFGRQLLAEEASEVAEVEASIG